MKTIYKMALKYYPHLWNDEMLRNLVEKGGLTTEEYELVTGHPYEENNENE